MELQTTVYVSTVVSLTQFFIHFLLETSKLFEILKLTATPKILKNSKKSWKKSWKVMEFEELKRVQNLYQLYVLVFFVTKDLPISLT